MEFFVDNNNNIIHNNNNTINCIFASLCVYVTRVYMHKCLHGVCVCVALGELGVVVVLFLLGEAHNLIL